MNKTIKIITITVISLLFLYSILYFASWAYTKIEMSATKKEIELCKCLKEYKTDMECGRFNPKTPISASIFLNEKTNLLIISNSNQFARSEYEKMEVQYKRCTEKY